MYRVFKPCDSVWRGLGTIAHSGLALAPAYARFDAAQRFNVNIPAPVEPPGCRCGEVLRGTIAPPQCELFGRVCTPDNPKGACMVSSEGSCAAHYNYGK
jgi:hydrogenase expression/formation protein HypD